MMNLLVLLMTVTLAWDANTETCGVTYKVYRSIDDAPYTVLTEQSETTVMDMVLDPVQQFVKYYVTANCSGKDESPMSNVVIVAKTIDPPPPVPKAPSVN